MTLYTSKVIAQWLCLTERRVRQLRDEGVIVEARPGLYELQPTVARYIKYLGGAGKESLNTERMKLTAEKRKAAEMDNDLRRGDLHSTQDIEKGIQTMCLNIRSRFLAMPAKLFYPCRAAREQGRRGGRRSIYSRTVRQRARPLRYDAINNRERRKTEHGVFYRQIPE